MSMEFLLMVMKMFWNHVVIIIASLHEYTKDHLIVLFKVNYGM